MIIGLYLSVGHLQEQEEPEQLAVLAARHQHLPDPEELEEQPHHHHTEPSQEHSGRHANPPLAHTFRTGEESERLGFRLFLIV